MGLEPVDWKPMASVGPGCCELRVRTARDAYRVLYVASVGDAVYVRSGRRNAGGRGLQNVPWTKWVGNNAALKLLLLPGGLGGDPPVP